jgi:hypothetical protein
LQSERPEGLKRLVWALACHFTGELPPVVAGPVRPLQNRCWSTPRDQQSSNAVCTRVSGPARAGRASSGLSKPGAELVGLVFGLLMLPIESVL